MNLWKNLDKITTQLQNNSTKALLLDFDGTLAPIVKSPEKARLSIKTRSMLKNFCQKPGFYLAIISGRKLEDVKEKVRLPNIIYGGNHGLEGEISGKKYSFPIPNRALKALEKIHVQLDKIASQFTGVFVEDKESVLAFHYRMAEKDQIPSIKSLFKEMLKPFIENELISAVSGKMVFDIRPKVVWSKGAFAKLIVNVIHIKTKAAPIVIYIGDDVTDEDVFKKLKNEITIKVGKRSKSFARYRLKDTKEVFKFLEWLLVYT